MATQRPHLRPAPDTAPDTADAVDAGTGSERAPRADGTFPRQRTVDADPCTPTCEGLWVQDGPVRVGLRRTPGPDADLTTGATYQLLVEVRADSGIPGTPDTDTEWLVPPGGVVSTTARSGSPGPQLRIFLTAAAAELRAAVDGARALGPALAMLATRAGQGWLR